MHDSVSSLASYNLATELILCKERVRDQTVELFFNRTEDVSSHPFTKHLQALYTNYTDDDIINAVYHFFRSHGNLWQWYEALLSASGIRVLFFNQQPWIEQSGFLAWRHITRRIDPDGLLAFALVHQNQGIHEAACLCNWPTTILPWDRDLDRLFKKEGMADTHVHLTSCDPVPLLWQRLMQGETRFEALPKIDTLSKSDIDHTKSIYACLWEKFRAAVSFYPCSEQKADLNTHECLVSKLLKIDTAKSLQKAELDTHECIVSNPVKIDTTKSLQKAELDTHECLVSKPVEIDITKPLLGERLVLTWAWKQVREGDQKTTRLLDQYLVNKSLFFSRCRQSPGTHPGLRHFHAYFNRAKGEGSFTKGEGNFSPKANRKLLQRRLDYLAESDHLRYIELRIRPFNQLDEYIRYFKYWHDHLRLVFEQPASRSQHPGRVIRFVIHFKREKDKGLYGYALPFARLRKKLARQSAVLHRFRRSYPQYARYITGIDVASQERDCPPEIFTPYFRLLRGNCDSILQIPSTSPLLRHTNKELHGPWCAFATTGDDCQAVGLPRLGLTYHAGEDIYLPLCGMCHMDEVVRYAGFESGDRIGHGLAAGWDLSVFQKKRGKGLVMPQGELFDTLVWLHERIMRLGHGFEPEMRRVEKLLHPLAQTLYGHTADIHVYHDLAKYRHAIPIDPTAPKPFHDPVLEMICCEWHDAACIEKRSQLVNIPDLFWELDSAALAVQDDLLKELAEKRIVVEFNPLSNWIVGNMENLEQHPFFKYHAVQQHGLMCSFNTDNPAVFDTCVEMEFALMYQAILNRNKGSKHDAIRVLDHVRQTGVDSVFGHAGG